MNLIKLLSAGAALVALTVPAHAQQPAPAAAPAAPAAQGAAAAQEFTPERFRAHVAFLADDLLEGRQAGTRGYDIGARYVATQFEALGLRPAHDGGWYQQVPLARSTGGSSGGLSVGERRFASGEGMVYLPGTGGGDFSFDAPVVFGGTGIVDAATNRNDLQGLDLAGKILVLVAPTNPEAARAFSASLQNAATSGARGIVIIRPAAAATATPLGQLAGRVGRAGQVTLAQQPGSASGTGAAQAGGAAGEGLKFLAMADRAFLEPLFAGSSTPLNRVLADADAGRPVRGFALRQQIRAERSTPTEAFTSPNVLAVIPGSDPALANEYVLLMAHLDGHGIIQGDLPEGQTDRIRNGAMDNATGVSTLIEVAREFMEPGNRPKRSILLAAVTAEEVGLLGSRYLASNPVLPEGHRVVGVVNLDMPILTYDFQDVVAFGAEHSTMATQVDAAARSMNVRLSPDPLPEENLFTRSDHYSFVQEGVPSVFLMTGFANGGEQGFRGFLANEYHSPRDDLSLPFNWNAAARFAELNYRIARQVANEAEAPRWYEGSPFAPEGARTARRPAN